LGLSSAEEIYVLREIFKDAEPGQWVLSETKKGYQSKTKVLAREGSLLTIEISNIIKGQIESKTIQKIDLEKDKIIEAKIIPKEGEVIQIEVEKLLFNHIKVSKYKEEREEEVTVPAGTFKCTFYKSIVDDNVIYLWLNDEIPVNHIVKAKIRHSLLKLVAYGVDEIEEGKIAGKDLRKKDRGLTTEVTEE